MLLLLFLGTLGAHRFHVEKNGTAIVYILTLGGFLVCAVMDLIKILKGTFTDIDGRPIRKP